MDGMVSSRKDTSNRKEREVSIHQIRIPGTGRLPPCAVRDPAGAGRARMGIAPSYDPIRVLLVLEKNYKMQIGNRMLFF